ncbi:hypothetical protein BOW51_08295 [Solemya velesiana gill symbiont]|uniref:Radical SAM C-terminal extension domain-containing protein n=1 Tax=Solemya velesiana gill symbiont TaxID=1918948 RepID=A0A1T2KTM0_9GAMM|nr:hypothetical protein BOW51_08295 [Solemya velesiana gill symbiont]
MCAHLIIGLPGEGRERSLQSLERVLELGVEGIKLHPLHVVKGTLLANQWRREEYSPLTQDEYITIAADMLERTPPDVVIHRATAMASPDILLTPRWCGKKWAVLNAVEDELKRRGTRQGSALVDKNAGEAGGSGLVLPAQGTA